LIACGLICWLDARRIVPENLALGVENWAASAEFLGQRLNAWKLEEYPQIYAKASDTHREVLWVGNSQLHAINQLRRGRDQVAAFHASKRLGEPVRCLTLPNANIQEHLATFEWALARRPVGWLVLPLVFDKLRNDSLRPGFEYLASTELLDQLSQRPTGKRLVGELTELQHAAFAANSAADKPLFQYSFKEIIHGLSLQNLSEHYLDSAVSQRWGLWARRPQLWATFLNDIYNLRNLALGLKSTTKRPILPLPFEKNMAAFDEMLDVAEAHGVNVLVYVAPIRQDVEPPYIMAEYLHWKDDVKRRIEIRRNRAPSRIDLADLDRLVPAELWGTVEESKEIDFMHFQGPAHELLGNRVAELLAKLGAGAVTEARAERPQTAP
jgi:hypothetical protein